MIRQHRVRVQVLGELELLPLGRGLHSSTFQLNLSRFPLTARSVSPQKRLR